MDNQHYEITSPNQNLCQQQIEKIDQSINLSNQLEWDTLRQNEDQVTFKQSDQSLKNSQLTQNEQMTQSQHQQNLEFSDILQHLIPSNEPHIDQMQSSQDDIVKFQHLNDDQEIMRILDLQRPSSLTEFDCTRISFLNNQGFINQEQQMQQNQDEELFQQNIEQINKKCYELESEIQFQRSNMDGFDVKVVKKWVSVLNLKCDKVIAQKRRNKLAEQLLAQLIQGKLDEPFINSQSNASPTQLPETPPDITPRLNYSSQKEMNSNKKSSFQEQWPVQQLNQNDNSFQSCIKLSENLDSPNLEFGEVVIEDDQDGFTSEKKKMFRTFRDDKVIMNKQRFLNDDQSNPLNLDNCLRQSQVIINSDELNGQFMALSMDNRENSYQSKKVLLSDYQKLHNQINYKNKPQNTLEQLQVEMMSLKQTLKMKLSNASNQSKHNSTLHKSQSKNGKRKQKYDHNQSMISYTSIKDDTSKARKDVKSFKNNNRSSIEPKLRQNSQLDQVKDKKDNETQKRVSQKKQNVISSQKHTQYNKENNQLQQNQQQTYNALRNLLNPISPSQINLTSNQLFQANNLIGQARNSKEGGLYMSQDSRMPFIQLHSQSSQSNLFAQNVNAFHQQSQNNFEKSDQVFKKVESVKLGFNNNTSQKQEQKGGIAKFKIELVKCDTDSASQISTHRARDQDFKAFSPLPDKTYLRGLKQKYLGAQTSLQNKGKISDQKLNKNRVDSQTSLSNLTSSTINLQQQSQNDSTIAKVFQQKVNNNTQSKLDVNQSKQLKNCQSQILEISTKIGINSQKQSSNKQKQVNSNHSRNVAKIQQKSANSQSQNITVNKKQESKDLKKQQRSQNKLTNQVRISQEEGGIQQYNVNLTQIKKNNESIDTQALIQKDPISLPYTLMNYKSFLSKHQNQKEIIARKHQSNFQSQAFSPQQNKVDIIHTQMNQNQIFSDQTSKMNYYNNENRLLDNIEGFTINFKPNQENIQSCNRLNLEELNFTQKQPQNINDERKVQLTQTSTHYETFDKENQNHSKKNQEIHNPINAGNYIEQLRSEDIDLIQPKDTQRYSQLSDQSILQDLRKSNKRIVLRSSKRFDSCEGNILNENIVKQSGYMNLYQQSIVPQKLWNEDRMQQLLEEAINLKNSNSNLFQKFCQELEIIKGAQPNFLYETKDNQENQLSHQRQSMYGSMKNLREL